MAAILVKGLDGEIERVRAFYALTGYRGGVQTGDLLVGAVCGGEIVGAVRIAKEHGVLVARGMRVLPNFQRQGIGARILKEVRPILDGPQNKRFASYWSFVCGSRVEFGIALAGTRIPALLPSHALHDARDPR